MGLTNKYSNEPKVKKSFEELAEEEANNEAKTKKKLITNKKIKVTKTTWFSNWIYGLMSKK